MNLPLARASGCSIRGYAGLALAAFAAVAAATAQERPRAPSPALVIPPYLQLPTQTGVTILWETDQALPSRVEFGTSESLGGVAEAEGSVTLHQVRLRGLSPGTPYFYRVRSGPLVSEVNQFRTAPSAGTRRWRLAVYGDSRTHPAIHRQIAEQIKKARVDLIVHTGDMVGDGRNHAGWRVEFFQPLAPLAGSLPWISAPGNHERDDANYFSYVSLPGNEHYYGFDYANAHFVGLDSNPWTARGPGSDQFAWLARHLREKRDATWTFVLFHHPLFSAHAGRAINSVRWDWAPLLLDPESRVDVVLNGHDHFYARNYPMGFVASGPRPGVLFLTTAGGGAPLYPTRRRDYVAVAKEVHHFTLFEFDGDRAELSAIDQDGRVFDRWSLTKGPTPPEDFCAYEVEELKHALRRAVAEVAPVRLAGEGVAYVNADLAVPTTFRVPVAGRLRWQTPSGWKMAAEATPFNLKPGEPLHIPIRADVADGPLDGSPALTIGFEAGRFRNRAIDVQPFRPAGPDEIVVRKTTTAERSDRGVPGELWQAPAPLYLLGALPKGGRRDQVRVFADVQDLWIGVRCHGVDHAGQSTSLQGEGSWTRQALLGPHVRVEVTDGTKRWAYAVSPERDQYATVGGREDRTLSWKVSVEPRTSGWDAAFAIQRKALPDADRLRINIVHRARQGDGFAEFQLCPTYVPGPSPDQIPDWRLQDAPQHFARLVLR